jgi:formylglycine-generating enzyme required for sulfatase activity
MTLPAAAMLALLVASQSEAATQPLLTPWHIPTTVPIKPGAFTMGVGATPLPPSVTFGGEHNTSCTPPLACGRTLGDFDERPNHAVHITKPFAMGAFEVTNEQYEQYDPAHRLLRGSHGMGLMDFEAVTMVSWPNASGYAAWLSARDPQHDWRLPTEAEWEYACRAGTTTHYNTGDTLPRSYWKNQEKNGWWASAYSAAPNSDIPMGLEPPLYTLAGIDGYLRGGYNCRSAGTANGGNMEGGCTQTPPNAWGVSDCHGNVEEWVSDWYDGGYYNTSPAADPAGPASGVFKVSRGGSYSAEVYYLRSANRLGNLPDEATWLVGFRVVAVPKGTVSPVPDGPTPLKTLAFTTPRLPPETSATAGAAAAPGIFFGPKPYVKITGKLGAEKAFGPLWSHHNHDPALSTTPSGDLIAIWFTTWEECGREAAIAISRLDKADPNGEWADAESLYDPPDRCMCCPALYHDNSTGEVLAFFSASAQASYGAGNVLLQRSTDSGVSWSETERAMPTYSGRHMCVETVIKLQSGLLALPADTAGAGTSLHLSEDNGKSWHDSGGSVSGIHGAVVELKNATLLGFGRGADRPCAIDPSLFCQAQSVSSTAGRTWTVTASQFPAVHGGQRHVVLRLSEGGILFIGFANGNEPGTNGQAGALVILCCHRLSSTVMIVLYEK